MTKAEIKNSILLKYDLTKVDIFQDEIDAINHILSYVLNIPIMEIRLMSNINLTASQEKSLYEVLDKLCIQEIPFQYITEKVNIYNETYYINESVLIPRQDTECIIELAISKINENKFCNMLDLCTGSGVIGISVAKNSIISSVDMVDISADALNVAEKNIELNGMKHKCKATKSDMFSEIIDKDSKYDIIVSNPPYITERDYENLSCYVKKEPKIALVAEDNGLYYYKKIAHEAKEYLNDKGILLLEIGWDEAQAVSEILSAEGFSNITIYKDFNSKDRVILCHFQNK